MWALLRLPKSKEEGINKQKSAEAIVVIRRRAELKERRKLLDMKKVKSPKREVKPLKAHNSRMQRNCKEDLSRVIDLTSEGRTASMASDHLIESVVERGNMLLAYQKVVRNKGAPGIDRMSVEELKHHLVKSWNQIKVDILNGEYKPSPVLRVAIPKPGGGERHLGIPTVIDRVIQQAVAQILEPIFDPGFSKYSYGFRKNRSAHDAVKQAKAYQVEGKTYVVDLDLEKFFDNVDQDLLMGRIRRKIKDSSVLKLIRNFLRAGVMINKNVLPTKIGTPQGGPLSPLLSNIMLCDLDNELEKRGHKFVRYADDYNIFVGSMTAGRRVMASITRFIESKLQLKVNRDKSAVDKPYRRKLLGYNFLPTNPPKIKIAKASIQRLKKNLKPIFRLARGKALDKVIKEDLNPKLRGWINYFGLTECPTPLRDLDSWLRHHLRNALWRRWRRTSIRYKVMKERGLTHDEALTASRALRGSWWSSGTKLFNKAFDLRYFKLMGLISLLEEWKYHPVKL